MVSDTTYTWAQNFPLLSCSSRQHWQMLKVQYAANACSLVLIHTCTYIQACVYMSIYVYGAGVYMDIATLRVEW